MAPIRTGTMMPALSPRRVPLADSAAIASLLALLTLCAPAPPTFAACSNPKCTDVTSIEKARALIQDHCGCTRNGQSHATYTKCVKSSLKLPDITALVPSKPCRNLIKRCESISLCGKPGAAVCCTLGKTGTVKSSIVRLAVKCRKGTACGEDLGFYSKFDACAPDGTCAGPPTTTTTSAPPTTTMARLTSTSVPATTSSSTSPGPTSTSTTRAPTTTTQSTTPTTQSSTPTTSSSTTTTTLPCATMSTEACDLGGCPGTLRCKLTTVGGVTACGCVVSCGNLSEACDIGDCDEEGTHCALATRDGETRCFCVK